MIYYPTTDQWLTQSAAELGLRSAGLQAAVDYHATHESAWRRDFLTESGRFIGVADEPEVAPPGPAWTGYVPGAIGPIRARGGPNGIVLRGGVIAAEWGDTTRPDMSFSIAKSYLAVLAGLAVARGLIRSIDDRVRDYALDDGLASAQNRNITWRHLLEQTSEWQGTLWGKPDAIDHNRDVGKSDLGASDKGTARPLRPPGTVWEYNDVRVNRLSLSLLQVFREPLADVLRREVMDPIGASSGWAWQPYANSWVELDGARLPSVPGGSHWGGGLWMATRDHARFGLLMLRGGRWGGRQVVPAEWIAELRRPSPVNPQYGFLWWLNAGRQQFPGAPESSFAARGAGSNVVWMDPEHDLVVVVRWIDKASVAGFVERVVASVERR
jgi:CubicO group peptidase (beta-lactamase class C family)